MEQKYGIERVSQIVTFGQYKLKNITKAILSFEGVTFQEANEITRDIPDLVDGSSQVTYELIEKVATDPDNEKFVSYSKQEKDALTKAYERLQDCFQKYPKVYDGIIHLTGCINSLGVHAGGVIICCHNISEHGAVIINKGGAYLPVLQFEMSDLDFFGFLKVDVLGLGTLDVIQKCMDLIGLDYDWYDSEDFDDQRVYDMLKAGFTTDIFQMATPMPTRMVREFDCKSLLDLSAVNAGNRPGPLEKDQNTGKSMVDLYIERKKSGDVPSVNPKIDPILKKTMGVVFFQEQCIFIAQEMAGYNLGNADLRVRKTLCKKLRKKIPEIRNEFVYGKKSLYDEDHNVIGMSQDDSEYCEGCITRGFTEQESNAIFDVMEAMAKYAFNQSHSGCYSVIGYKLAWVSLYYPAEFAIANCTVNDASEKIQATLSLARKRKIPILGPDINSSQNDFSVEVVNGEKSVRYGIKAIKGVGVAVINFLNEFRKRYTKVFTTFDDFYNAVHNTPEAQQLVAELQAQTGKKTPNPIKKDVEEAFIKSGCFDFFEPNRFTLLNHYMIDIKKDPKYVLLDPKTFDRGTKLALEKAYLGDYISEHPLDPFPYADFDACMDDEFVETAGIVSLAQMKSTKKGTNYMCLSIQAKDGVERKVNFFNEEKSLELKKDIKKNQIVVVKGRVNKQYGNITATSIKILAAAKQMANVEALTVDDLTKPAEPPKVEVDNGPTIPGMAEFFGFSAL